MPDDWETSGIEIRGAWRLPVVQACCGRCRMMRSRRIQSWASNIQTTRDEGQTHPMLHVVLNHTVSPRTNPGPRNAMPQDTGRLQAQHGYARPWSVLRRMVGAPAYGRDAGPVSGRRPTVGAPAPCRDPNAWSVPRPIVGAQAHGQYPGALSVRKRLIGAPRMVSAPAPCRCAGALSVPGPLPVLRCMVGAPAHGQCSGPFPVP